MTSSEYYTPFSHSLKGISDDINEFILLLWQFVQDIYSFFMYFFTSVRPSLIVAPATVIFKVLQRIFLALVTVNAYLVTGLIDCISFPLLWSAWPSLIVAPATVIFKVLQRIFLALVTVNVYVLTLTSGAFDFISIFKSKVAVLSRKISLIFSQIHSNFWLSPVLFVAGIIFAIFQIFVTILFYVTSQLLLVESFAAPSIDDLRKKYISSWRSTLNYVSCLESEVHTLRTAQVKSKSEFEVLRLDLKVMEGRCLDQASRLRKAEAASESLEIDVQVKRRKISSLTDEVSAIQQYLERLQSLFSLDKSNLLYAEQSSTNTPNESFPNSIDLDLSTLLSKRSETNDDILALLDGFRTTISALEASRNVNDFAADGKSKAQEHKSLILLSASQSDRVVFLEREYADLEQA